jgi:predicted ferric reductase
LKCNVALVKDDKYMVVTISPELYNLPRMQRVISYCLLKLKKNFSWEPSNHLFIAIPAVDVFQSHPFTISSLESEGKCQLLIQVHDGFTKRLYNRVRKGETEFMCIINGPYGSSHLHLPDTDNHASKHLMSIRNETTSLIQSKGDMVTMTTLDPILYSSSFSSMSSAQKEKIILVAGGIGLSLTLPLLRRYQKMAQYDLSFIWITRCESLAPLVGLDESQPNVRIWNSTKHGRPVMIQLLLDSLNGEYRMIHIIGCGPTSLMSSVRQFATERMNHSNVNLVLEEFSF